MDMANAAVKVPVTVLTAEVMESPTAWPSVVARLRMPRSLPASSFHCRHRSFSDRGGPQTASVSGTETARVVRMMETESGIGMLTVSMPTVNYVVMAELRRI